MKIPIGWCVKTSARYSLSSDTLSLWGVLSCSFFSELVYYKALNSECLYMANSSWANLLAGKTGGFCTEYGAQDFFQIVVHNIFFKLWWWIRRFSRIVQFRAWFKVMSWNVYDTVPICSKNLFSSTLWDNHWPGGCNLLNGHSNQTTCVDLNIRGV